MAKLKLFDKIKAELKDSLTKVNKGSIEKGRTYPPHLV